MTKQPDLPVLWSSTEPSESILPHFCFIEQLKPDKDIFWVSVCLIYIYIHNNWRVFIFIVIFLLLLQYSSVSKRFLIAACFLSFI